MAFIDSKPTLETQWRGIVLFGKNSATYKFAFGKAVLKLAEQGVSSAGLDTIAPLYADYIIKHIKEGNRQGLSNSSTFLAGLDKYIEGKISRDEAIQLTQKFGFKNVIDAFHNVGKGSVPERFYEFDAHSKVLHLDDNIHKLRGSEQGVNVAEEIEARWNLVETAWNLSLPISSVRIEAEGENEGLVITDGIDYRKPVTSTRNALSGYQRGKCFYSQRAIDLRSGDTDVDHFFPISKQEYHLPSNLNGVWNLVLAHSSLNRQKSAQAPAIRHLESLHNRNEYYISSKHPLGATIQKQTGSNESQRRDFLQRHFDASKQYSFSGWEPDYILRE
jgi:5-methylcytosine-specific restriction endonuclease McrA